MSPTPVHDQFALKAAELLGDGEWHSYEQTLRALMKLVPPGVATRKVARQRVTAGLPTERTHRHREPDEIIYSGARMIVVDYLRNKFFETQPKRASGAPPIGSTSERTIRMVRAPTALTVLGYDPLVAARERLQQQNETLRDQVTNLRGALIALGYGARADALAPPLSD